MTGILASWPDKGFILKFVKFGAVGFSGLIVDFGVTYIFKEKLGVHRYVANSLGFLVATASNYLLNRNWTFHNQDPEYLLQFGKFFVIALVGLALSNLIIFLLSEKLKWNFYLAKIFAIGAVAIWNFFANYLYTFTG